MKRPLLGKYKGRLILFGKDKTAAVIQSGL